MLYACVELIVSRTSVKYSFRLRDQIPNLWLRNLTTSSGLCHITVCLCVEAAQLLTTQ